MRIYGNFEGIPLIKVHCLGWCHTVDGSEIRLTSWYGKYLIIYQGFIHPNGGWPWDFWTINSIVTPVKTSQDLNGCFQK